MHANYSNHYVNEVRLFVFVAANDRKVIKNLAWHLTEKRIDLLFEANTGISGRWSL